MAVRGRPPKNGIRPEKKKKPELVNPTKCNYVKIPNNFKQKGKSFLYNGYKIKIIRRRVMIYVDRKEECDYSELFDKFAGRVWLCLGILFRNLTNCVGLRN